MQKTKKQKKVEPSRRLAEKTYKIREEMGQNAKIYSRISLNKILDFVDTNEKAIEQWECRPTEEEILQNKRNKWLGELCPHVHIVKPK